MATHDVVLYYLLNVSSAFYLSAVHNALYFVLDWHTTVFHFWHYCLTFCFLLLCSVIGMQRWSKPLSITPFILPITTQIIIVLLSNQIHSQIRSGSLYLLRYVSCHKSTKRRDLKVKFCSEKILKFCDFCNRTIWNIPENLKQNKVALWLPFHTLQDFTSVM